MSEFVEENDLVILGDRKEAQQHAIDLNVSAVWWSAMEHI